MVIMKENPSINESTANMDGTTSKVDSGAIKVHSEVILIDLEAMLKCYYFLRVTTVIKNWEH